MSLTNEECLKIAKNHGATNVFDDWDSVQTDNLEFTPKQLLATCAAIEAGVEKRVREEIATMADNRGVNSLHKFAFSQLANDIRNGGVK